MDKNNSISGLAAGLLLSLGSGVYLWNLGEVTEIPKFKGNHIISISSSRDLSALDTNVEFKSPLPGESEMVGEIIFNYEVRSSRADPVQIYANLGKTIGEGIKECGNFPIKEETYGSLQYREQTAVAINRQLGSIEFDNDPSSTRERMTVDEARNELKSSPFYRIGANLTPIKIDGDTSGTAKEEGDAEIYQTSGKISCDIDMQWMWTETNNGWLAATPLVSSGMIWTDSVYEKLSPTSTLSLPVSSDFYFTRGNIEPSSQTGISTKWEVTEATQGSSGTSDADVGVQSTPSMILKLNSINAENKLTAEYTLVAAILGAGVSIIVTSALILFGIKMRKNN